MPGLAGRARHKNAKVPGYTQFCGKPTERGAANMNGLAIARRLSVAGLMFLALWGLPTAALLAQTETDVVAHVHVRIEGKILEDQRDIALMRR